MRRDAMMKFDNRAREIEYVTLSEAKGLRPRRIVCQQRRSFASLSMTWGEFPCLDHSHSSSRPIWPALMTRKKQNGNHGSSSPRPQSEEVIPVEYSIANLVYRYKM